MKKIGSIRRPHPRAETEKVQDIWPLETIIACRVDDTELEI